MQFSLMHVDLSVVLIAKAENLLDLALAQQESNGIAARIAEKHFLQLQTPCWTAEKYLSANGLNMHSG